MNTKIKLFAAIALTIVSAAFSVQGLIPNDADGDGVPDSVDVCPAEDASGFDRDGDGCVDAFIGARHIEYWDDDAIIHYVINAQGAPNISNGTDFTAIQSAVNAWTAIPNTELGVVYDGTSTATNSNGMDGVNLVTFVDNGYPFSSLVLAVGLSTSFESDTLIAGRVYRAGEIFDADMVFNPTKTFKVGGAGPGVDIQSVATHEAGHLFGISHSSVQSSTMFYVLPGGLAARSLETDDELVFFKAYGSDAALASARRIDGTVVGGQSGQPVAGAAVFVLQGSDTVGCDYTLPDGSFSFPGLADGSYTVSIHPIDASAAMGYIQPGNINALVAAIAVENFVPESWDAAESAMDDAGVATPITVGGGNPTQTIEIVTNIDAVAPFVTQSNPVGGTNGVAIDAAYIVTFSEAIDLSTIAANFEFRELSTGSRRGGNLGIVDEGHKIVFTPSPPLAFGQPYRMTLSTGLQDEFGNGLASPYTLDVTTETEPAVNMTSLSPNKGVIGTTVVIIGKGFDVDPPAKVQFGNFAQGLVNATVTSATPTKLVITVPEGVGTGDVRVVNNDFQESNHLVFTVLSAAEIARGFESGQVDVLGDPKAITVVPDGGYAYVGTSTGVDAIVIDPSLPNYLTRTTIANFGGVDDVSATPTGLRVYGVSTSSRELIEINSDPTTGLLFNTILSTLDVGASPRGVVVEPSGYRAYIATDESEIQSWDIKLGSATYQQQVNALATPNGAGLQGALTVTPSGDRLLAVTDTGSLLFYSVADESLLTSVSVGANPRAIAIEPTEERAYVSHGDGRISVVNITGAPFKVQDIFTGGSLRGLAVTPASRYIYAADREIDNLKIIDLDPTSATFRSIVEDIEAPTNPIDVSLTPDGLYALSLLQGDGPGAPGNPSRLLVTTIGAGPALRAVYPQTARVGSQIVLSGDSFGDASDLDVATVDFNGIIVTPTFYGTTQIAAMVPPGALSGPVSIHVKRNGVEEIEVSNALAFEVIQPSLDGGTIRSAGSILSTAGDDYEDAIAVAPDGNTVLVGNRDGDIIAYDTRPGSPKFHQEIGRFHHMDTAIEDIAYTPDGKTAYVTASADILLKAIRANPNDPGFGSLRTQYSTFSSGLDNLEVSPNNRLLFAENPQQRTVGIFTIANHFNDEPMFQIHQTLSANTTDIAVHPAGTAMYIAATDNNVILTATLDEESIEFGTVFHAYEPPGTPSVTPLSIAVYPGGSKLLVLCMQLSGPNTRTILEYNINAADPTILSAGNVYTPPGTASHVYQERMRISPKGDFGVRSIDGEGLTYFNLSNPAVAVGQVDLTNTFTHNDFEFTPDGNRLYFASSFENSLRVYDFQPANNVSVASGGGQLGTAGQTLPTPIRVYVEGYISIGEFFQEIPVPGIPVTFDVTSGGGMLKVGDQLQTHVVVSSDDNGFATVEWVLGPAVGQQTVTALSSGLFNSPLVINATASPDPGTLPLALSEIIPLHGTNNASVTTAVLATFSRPVAPASIGTNSFYLQVPGGSPIPAAVGFTDNNRKVSLTPITSLPYSQQIQVVYAAAIQDASGGALTTPGTSQFGTQAPPPPRIASIFPPSSLPGVAITISGAGFSSTPASNIVRFGAVTATPIASATNFVRVLVPATAATGNVQVSVGAQTSNSAPFTVLVPNTSPIDDVIANVGVGSSAKSVVISADGALCYTVSTEGDVIVPVDIEGQSTFPAIPVGDQPVAIVMHPAGKLAYVANFNSGTVSVIDTDPTSPTFHSVVQTITVGTGPIDLAVSPDGDRVVVANATSNDLSIIDGDPLSLTHNQVVANAGTGSSARSVVISGDGALMYVGTDTGFVVISATSYSVVANAGTGSSAKSIVISPDGTLLFILTTSGNVLIVDITPGSTSENQVVANVGAGSSAKSIVISADGTLLYIVQENSSDVLVVAIDVIPGVGAGGGNGAAASFTVQTRVVDRLTAGDDPSDVAVDPSGSGRVVVANAGDKTITIFGKPFQALETTFKVVPSIIIPKLPGFYILGIIQLPSTHSVRDIDLASIRVFGTVGIAPGKFYYGDATKDGVEDLSVLFCRDEFLAGMPENGEHVDATVTGLVNDEEFEGTDAIRVLRPTITDPEENEMMQGGLPFVIRWTTPLQILPCDKVKIEWRPNGDDEDDIDCDFHAVSDVEDQNALDIKGSLLKKLTEPAEAQDAGWLLIRNNVDNDGDYTWQVPVGYFPNARLRITLLWLGLKVGSSEVPFVIEMPVPTQLASIGVTMESGAAVMRWATTLESQMQGFHVVRSESENGRYDIITKDMIPASGASTGGKYEYRDDSVAANRTYWYKLQEVSDNGLGAEYGPYSVTYRVTNKLEQNVPNPFNPTTVIAYSIAADEQVNLTIYDVGGRKVRTLVNQRQRADAYKFTWDGSNEAGQRVASGVYFYKLVAGKFTQTKKMVLLK